MVIKSIDEVNKQLDKIKILYREKIRTQSLLDDMKNRLKSENERFKKLSDELSKEYNDVDKLEGLSLTSLFHTILGDKDSQLEKERQELLAIKLRHAAAKKSIDNLSCGIEELICALDKLGDVETVYHGLIKEKENIILNSKDEKKKALMKIFDEIRDIRLSITELDEAIDSGKAAYDEADIMVDKLKNAEDWGTWDMFGGGFIATATKHSRIDDAGESAIRLQRLIDKFNVELSDVQLDTSDISVNIDSFDRFADFFFDGLISDWIVQSKISDSLINAENTKHKLERIIKSLDQARMSQEMMLQKLLIDKQYVIENFEIE